MSEQVRILLVEDEASIARLTELVLRDAGYDVEAVSNQAKAMEQITDPSLGLVIADTDKGGASRLSGLAPLLAAAGTRPVILFTAHHFSDSAIKDAGFAGYIQKPYDIDDLVATVNRVLKESGRLPQSGPEEGTVP